MLSDNVVIDNHHQRKELSRPIGWLLGALLPVSLALTPLGPAIASAQPVQTEPARQFPGQPMRDAMQNAADRFEQLAKQQPNHAPHYVGVADWYTAMWCFGFLPREQALPKAKSAANKAIELDDNLAAAHTALGVIRMSDWDWAEAERELQRAIELDPQRANSRHWYALYLSAMGRHNEAILQSEQAVKLDPSPGNRTGLGAVLYFARDFQRMQEHMQATLKQHPDFAIGYDWLGMALVQLGKFDDAIATYEKAVELSGGVAEVKAGLGHAYGIAGRKRNAREISEELHELARQYHIPPVQIAFVHVSLGEQDEAFRWLERAFDERSWELAFLQVEPWLDDLRSEQRFQQLLRRMRFPDATTVTAKDVDPSP